jgi:hypothetical protein
VGFCGLAKSRKAGESWRVLIEYHNGGFYGSTKSDTKILRDFV